MLRVSWAPVATAAATAAAG